jgi:hypothetical protein
MSEHLSLDMTSNDDAIANDSVNDARSSDYPVTFPLTQQRSVSTKTLSQFPAALVPTSQGARSVSYRNHSLERVSANHNGLGHARGVMNTIAVSGPWSCLLRTLCFANPIGEARGAACAIWALAETLRDLPSVERSTARVALAEVNTRGEVLVGSTGAFHAVASSNDEAELVWELIGWLQASAIGVEDSLEDDNPLPFATGVSPRPVAAPAWLSELQDVQDNTPLSTLNELSDWLEEHLRIPREQQSSEIGRWARQHRRLSQSREGQLIEQLGVALTRLSIGPGVRTPPKVDAWKWLASAALMATTVGIASRLLFH